MLDIQFIRDNPDLVAEKSQQKGYKVDIQKLLEADSKRRELLQHTENLRRRRNELSEQSQGSKPSGEQISQGRELKEQLGELEEQLSTIETEFLNILKQVPNM